MEIRMSQGAKPVTGVEEVVAQVQRDLPARQAQWIRQLRENPGAFADLERTIHQAFDQIADQLVAGMLAEVTKPVEWAQDAKKK